MTFTPRSATAKTSAHLTNAPGYDAEATVSPERQKDRLYIERDGDLELYAMDNNGKNVKRLTNELGYDGGAFFSPDGKADRLSSLASENRGRNQSATKTCLANT